MAASALVSDVTQDIVDLFLRDEDLNVSEDRTEAHDGEIVAGGDQERGTSQLDMDFVRKKIGRDLKYCGDEFVEHYRTTKHSSFPSEVKSFFDKQIQEAGGDPEESWQRFHAMMDDALKEIGMDQPVKMLGALLISVKGLYYLGSAVRTFTLRYIQENDLDRDLKRLNRRNENLSEQID